MGISWFLDLHLFLTIARAIVKLLESGCSPHFYIGVSHDNEGRIKRSGRELF